MSALPPLCTEALQSESPSLSMRVTFIGTFTVFPSNEDKSRQRLKPVGLPVTVVSRPTRSQRLVCAPADAAPSAARKSRAEPVDEPGRVAFDTGRRTGPWAWRRDALLNMMLSNSDRDGCGHYLA